MNSNCTIARKHHCQSFSFVKLHKINVEYQILHRLLCLCHYLGALEGGAGSGEASTRAGAGGAGGAGAGGAGRGGGAGAGGEAGGGGGADLPAVDDDVGAGVDHQQQVGDVGQHVTPGQQQKAALVQA